MYARVTNLVQFLEKKLDGTAMYRTVTLALAFLTLCALGLGVFGLITYTLPEQLLSLVIALTVAMVMNIFWSRILRVTANHESAVITALILFFLVIPAQLSSITDSWLIAAAVFLAISSKYLLVWRKQHILNPAAFGVFGLAGLFALNPTWGYFESTWWIGRPELFLPLLIAGSVVVYKIRKWTPVLAFLGVGFLVYLYEEWNFFGIVSAPEAFWISGPSLFLAFFMLTEPFTMPPTKRLQAGYGALVAALSQTTLFLNFDIKMTPELALLFGNVAFFPATLKRKLILPLREIHEIAKNTYELTFEKPTGLRFTAGQYLEWMLPHAGADNRGIRRYFTIASAPSDPSIRIGVRFGDTISSFKTALKALKPGQEIIASQLAGDFILPKEGTTKLAFIAGGIGITPFMSHLYEMQHTSTRYNTILFYGNNTEAEIAYKDQLQALRATLPLRVVHVLAKETIPNYETGYLTAEMLQKHAPDFSERTWYISGPPVLVNIFKKTLRNMGVPKRNIICDFFPGLA